MKTQTRIKLSVALVLILTQTACAFREPAAIDDARVKISVDWEAGADGAPRPEVKATRDLISHSTDSYEAQGFVTLPVVAPERVSLGVQVPEGVFVEDPRFVRGRISVGGLESSILASLTGFEREDGLIRVEVQLGGLRTVMPTTFSARGRVELEFFGGTSRQLLLSFGLRTPPSELSRTPGSTKSAREQSKPGQPGILNPVVHGRQFNLIQVFDFTNEEDAAVELQIPRKVSGRFFQTVERWDWRDLGCRGNEQSAGVEQRRYADQINYSDSLYLFPVDGELNREAEKSYWSPESRESIPRTVASGQSLRIGLYAVGADADQWSERGPRPTALEQRRVAGACRSRCIEWFTPGCGARCMVEALVGCVSWKTWRDPADVSSGFVNQASFLEFGAAIPTVRYRFGDFGPNQDGQIREVSLSESRFEVKWE